MKTSYWGGGVFWFACAVVSAQGTAITEDRVRETVGWLAADERMGRDTGSPELVAAGEWIAARFAAAGLRQVQEGSWYHSFPMTGFTVDSSAVVVKLTRHLGKEEPKVFELAADVDVRQRSAADAVAGTDDPCTVALFDDPVLQRLIAAGSARSPVVLEIPEDHPAWLGAAGKHEVLGKVRQASRPVFYVRPGVLPAKPGAGDSPTWTVTWSTAAAVPTEVPQHNVMALWPGTDKKDEFVVVSAHYDHIGVGQAKDGDAIRNGADDNATGTTGVLLLAEALAKLPPCRRSLLFVCFTGEERGLLGSRQFVATPPVPLEKVAVVLNLEMLGRPEPEKGGKAWFTGSGYSDLASIAEPALARGGVGLVPFRMADQLFAASDNYPFALAGVVAHSLSAGSLHEDYHQPSDEVAKLDLPHMTTVLRGLLELTIELGNRDEPPAWSEAGKALLEKRRARTRERTPPQGGDKQVESPK